MLYDTSLYRSAAGVTPEGVIIVGILLTTNDLRFHALNNDNYHLPATVITTFTSIFPINSNSLMTMSRDGKYLAYGNTGFSDVYVYERKPCHSSCATCSGPNADECITCVDGSPSSGSKCDNLCSSNCELCKLGSTLECIKCNQASTEKHLTPAPSSRVAYKQS